MLGVTQKPEMTGTGPSVSTTPWVDISNMSLLQASAVCVSVSEQKGIFRVFHLIGVTIYIMHKINWPCTVTRFCYYLQLLHFFHTNSWYRKHYFLTCFQLPSLLTWYSSLKWYNNRTTNEKKHLDQSWLAEVQGWLLKGLKLLLHLNSYSILIGC